MKKSFLRYGVYASLFLIIFNTLTWVIAKLTGNNGILSVVTGFTAIILCLSFVYFGIRWYRDKQNSGVLSFSQGLKTGMLIVLLPAVCLGLLDVAYTTFINPQFYPNYIQHQEALLRASRSPADFAIEAPKMRKQMEFYSQPWADFTLMFLNVACVGLIITVISTFILKRANQKTRQATGILQTETTK